MALISCRNITVANLTLEKNLEGIVLAYSNNCTIYGNSLIDNGDVGYGYGSIVIYQSSNNTIRNNTVATNDWTGMGILIDQGSNHNIVSENKIVKTSDGIRIPSTASHNEIFGNHLEYNTRGIGIESSASYNVIRNNYVAGSGQNGMAVNGQYNSILENDVIACKYGISIGGQHNVIVGNNIAENYERGIFAGGTYNNISDNTIINNNEGVYISSGCQNNCIYHNNFVDNMKHVTYYWSGDGNFWNSSYPTGGNYWSGYENKYPNATELDGSGLWNTPYVINAKNIDYCPLMAPTKPVTRKFIAYNSVKVEVYSNSSVSQFQFNINIKSISFNITGPAGTKGFCDITIPLSILWGGFTLYMDDVQLEEGVNYTKTCNDVQCIFHITYAHSKHRLEIFGTQVIRNFQAWLQRCCLLRLRVYLQ